MMTIKEPIRATLRDGTEILIRMIRPDDRERLLTAYRSLTSQSRYFRFMTTHETLSDEQLKCFTETDHMNQVAWGAFDRSSGEEIGIGFAQYVRLSDEPNAAEFAIMVIDAFQKRGLGTMLLELIIRSARENGISIFKAYVLEENKVMLKMFKKFGAQVDRKADGLVEVDLTLAAYEDPLDRRE